MSILVPVEEKGTQPSSAVKGSTAHALEETGSLFYETQCASPAMCLVIGECSKHTVGGLLG